MKRAMPRLCMMTSSTSSFSAARLVAEGRGRRFFAFFADGYSQLPSACAARFEPLVCLAGGSSRLAEPDPRLLWLPRLEDLMLWAVWRWLRAEDGCAP